MASLLSASTSTNAPLPNHSHSHSHSNDTSTSTRAQIQDLIEELRGGQIEDADALLGMLAGPLDAVGLLPPLLRVHLGVDENTNGRGQAEKMEIDIHKHIPQIQRVLLSHVVPTWREALEGEAQGKGAQNARPGMSLIDQYFCPGAFVNGSEAAGEVARAAYATLVSTPGALALSSADAGVIGEGRGQGYGYGVKMLARLAVEYPIDRLYKAVFLSGSLGSGRGGKGKGDKDGALLRGVAWEDCVRDVCKVPVVVANALAAAADGGGGEVPDVLENAAYFNRMSLRCEELVWVLSASSSSSSSASVEQESLTYLLTKLVNLGVFPPHPPVARSQPSFFQSALPAIRARLSSSFSSSSSDESARKYSVYWASLFQHIASSSSITLQSILASLFASLHVDVPFPPSSSSSPSASAHTHIPVLAQDITTRARVKREAALLRALAGAPSPSSAAAPGAFWQIATSLILSRDWPLAELHARVFVAWVSGGASLSSVHRDGQAKAQVDLKGTVVLDAFLGTVLDVWASPEHVKHSLISRHRYTTALLLLTISYFPSTSASPAPAIMNLVSSPAFIASIGTYIAHLDPAVRRCGMLAAEVVAHLCGRKLDFGGWDAGGGGEGEGLGWCKAMREVLGGRDVDVDVDAAELDDEHHAFASPKADAQVQVPSTSTPPPTRATFLPNPSGYDSDDSLTGYTSPPSANSSRSSSPTPSELADIEKDPTLNVGVKKVPRPVYLAQLGELLRGVAAGGSGGGNGGRGVGTKTGPDDAHEADRMQMALDCAEGLIRRKKGYGSELDENAVNLVYALLSLQDNFDLDGFAEKRQAAMTALIVCAPIKATPALIQEFFKNQYSVDQRFVALNALAMGARELADMPVPPTPSTANPRRTAFPSKTLPGSLHHRYISAGDIGGSSGSAGTADRGLLPRMVEQLASDALQEHSDEVAKGGGAGTTTRGSPALIRERRLRVQRPHLVSEIPSSSSLNPFSHSEASSTTNTNTNTQGKSHPKFIDIAAQHFILPLTTSFWAFLRDSHSLEQRTAHLAGRARYRGAGTGLILNPLVLAQFVRTLAVLVHAARNAREWMAVVAPEALEVGVALGTRPVSSMEEEEDDDDGGKSPNTEGNKGPAAGTPNKEASVLTATLELALVVLDGALELDGGRVLGLEHTALILGLGEWAGKVFAGLERGLGVQGGGGAHEARLSRAAAGVLLKVDELTSRWNRSMIDV